jgi:hypothetical protein
MHMETVSRREVAECFLRIEVDKLQRNGKPFNDVLEILASTESDVFWATFRAWSDRLTATRGPNPLLLWLIGTPVVDRTHMVKAWHRRTVELSDLYVWNLNPSMKSDLDSVAGNLAGLAKIIQQIPDRYPEYNDSGRKVDFETLFGIDHRAPARAGSYELIDGAHRAVQMIRKSKAEAKMYVAELHERYQS